MFRFNKAFVAALLIGSSFSDEEWDCSKCKIDNFIGQDFESESVFFDYYYDDLEVGYNLTHTATVTNMGNVGSTFTQTYKECISGAEFGSSCNETSDGDMDMGVLFSYEFDSFDGDYKAIYKTSGDVLDGSFCSGTGITAAFEIIPVNPNTIDVDTNLVGGTTDMNGFISFMAMAFAGGGEDDVYGYGCDEVYDTMQMNCLCDPPTNAPTVTPNYKCCMSEETLSGAIGCLLGF